MSIGTFINFLIAGFLFLSTADQAPGWIPPVMTIVFVLGALLGPFVVLPISFYWQHSISLGSAKACEYTIENFEDANRVSWGKEVVKCFTSTSKFLEKFLPWNRFYLSVISSTMIVAGLFSYGLKYTGTIVLILDAVTYGCLYWLMKNYNSISSFALEAAKVADGVTK